MVSISTIFLLAKLTKKDGNVLSSFELSGPTSLPHLHTLRLGRNRLGSLDVSNFPSLRELYLDGNRIQSIDGLGSLEHLECLSIREQENLAMGASGKEQILSNCSEIRSLHLSGNLPPSLNPNINFLNLQHLELATCGLQTLPPALGKMLPNVRTLNLNFNALTDISPLAGIARLSKLLIAGNRLTRLRKTIRVLSSLRSLKEVDLRHNPLTHGFYALVMPSRLHPTDIEHVNMQDAPSEIEPYTLPPADAEADETFQRKLDPDTRLRRAVYEKIMGHWCRSIKIVDGLTFNRSRAMKRDEVYDRLVTLKILRDRRAQAN